jgi:DNA repair exonuclease SbcCD ATPase subunit
MLKINKITVENFRGIKSPVILDFVKGSNSTSTLIYGRNGTGKSSIVDSREWLINSKIEFLTKEGVSEKDYPHKLSNGDNVYINVDFSHTTINSVKAQYNKTRVTSPINSGEYAEFKNYTVYPNFLRYSDLQEFVFKTKGEKYKYIAKFFGLEKFTKNQSDIQASFTRISTQLAQYKVQIEENRKAITAITEIQEIDEVKVILFINDIAKKYDIEEITEYKHIYKIEKALSEIVKANPIATAINEWNSFLLRLNQFYPISKVKQDCKDLETVFNDLKKDEANITKLILIDLYTTAKETLLNLEDKSTCPICDKLFEGNLEEHIAIKHKVLEELNNKKQDYILKRDALIKKFDQLNHKVAIIQSEKSPRVKESFILFYDDIDKLEIQIPKILAILKTQLKDLTSLGLSALDEVSKIDIISDIEMTYKQFVLDLIKSFSEDEKTTKLATDFSNLIQLKVAYTSYLRNEKKINYLSDICDKLGVLFSKLTEFIQAQIQHTFTQIQTDLIECYNFLEGTNQYLKNPEIKLVVGKDKAVELEIDFVNEKITPAYKFMSESQINSFGLSIFLAAVRHFNSNFKFMILDDVINSFDAFKRPKVAQLLAAKFSDFQILMLTHDQVFFDTMQRHFPQWNRYKFSSWDYTTGPRCNFSNNYTEEVEKLIIDDDPIGAGQKLGRYLEMVFGIINENLQTPIRYKLENTYTLSEFYEPLVKRIKEKLKSPNKQHKISILFGEFEQGTIFRNYCAHWKDESSQFTSPEIESIFKKWLEIEAEMYCPECKSYCHYENISNTEYVRCNCGNLNLKLDEKFV